MEQRTTIQITEDLRIRLRKLAARRDLSYQELLSDMADVFEELDINRTVVSVPKKLFDLTKNNLDKGDMSSVSEYVTFLLRLINSDKEMLVCDTRDLEKKLCDRLEALGYI